MDSSIWNMKNNIPLTKIRNEKDATEIIRRMIELSQLKKLDTEKKNLLQSRLFEISSNALTHSHSELGIICNGYYNNKKTFIFSIYDLGIGIPNSVRKFKKDENIVSIDALKWALKKGNSTKVADYII